MRVLVIGSGGREHAIVWALKRSPLVREIIAIPGNPGIAKIASCYPISVEDYEKIIQIATEDRIDLVVIGPEQPLADGLADILRKIGVAVFGPGKKASMLEASKSFAKSFMLRHGIPTARAMVCREKEEGLANISRFGFPVVIKADGLAHGKGVGIAHNWEEAEQWIDRVSQKGQFLIEEYLEGEECSMFFLCDSKSIMPFSSARDYKRLRDGDKGPNTGGMGAISKAFCDNSKVWNLFMEKVARPFLKGIWDEGIDYRGVVYAGCILTSRGIYVLEFNSRFGDPEAQVILPRLKSDFANHLMECANGNIKTIPTFDEAYAVCVVMVSCGYPDHFQTGFPISGLSEIEKDILVFYAGTGQKDDEIVTAGGRVLGVTALGNDARSAREKVYSAVSKLHFHGAYYRKDIGIFENKRC